MTANTTELSMHDLFRAEAKNQIQELTSGLLALERNPTAADQLEICMRAAHSLKGAARIVGIETGVALTHAMEDFFVAAQRGGIVLGQQEIDLLLKSVDLVESIAKAPDLELGQLGANVQEAADSAIANLASALALHKAPAQAHVEIGIALSDGSEPLVAGSQLSVSYGSAEEKSADRVVRVTVNNLNRLLGLAGESLVDSRWLKPFGQSLLRLKLLHDGLGKAIDNLRHTFSQGRVDDQAENAITDVNLRISECRQFLSERFAELEISDRRSTTLAQRLYDQALACRMRPFADGVMGFPRMVRDLGNRLGKHARLDILGATTQVDRDILERLEAPLGHLLRNAVDHGIETPDERKAADKPIEGVICLEAHHSAGSLQIIVSDDGRGIDLTALKGTVVNRGLANAETAGKLNERELLGFLFLPGFTMKRTVTEISGRGVGLDVVQDMIKQVRGVVNVSLRPGGGTRFHLQLPLTLSVVRTLLAEVGGEPYAFPFAYIVRAVKLPKANIEVLEGREYFNCDGRRIGLVMTHQVFESREPRFVPDELSVIVVGDQLNQYGLIVDRFLGGRELVVQPLDPRLGKIQDISAGALMEDGSPVLIVDVEDIIRSVERLAYANHLNKVRPAAETAQKMRRKRVLVVDDSLTVRELQRKLLHHYGYDVEVAVDGIDGWNAARRGRFDLIVTDVDMPRMDGIELITLIKKDPNLNSLPIVILSYKDREEDRRRGLDAGADHYLTKGSFHDNTLVQVVADLIGESSV